MAVKLYGIRLNSNLVPRLGGVLRRGTGDVLYVLRFDVACQPVSGWTVHFAM